MSCCNSQAKALAPTNPPPATATAATATAVNGGATTAASTTPTKRMPTMMQKRTFYRRRLPDTCTALSSPEGQALFASALANQGLKSFYALIQQYSTQVEPAFCGLTTLVIVLNALSMDPRKSWKGPWRWYEETMLNCCLDLEEVKETGITIKDFYCLAVCQGLKVTTVLADENDNTENGTGVERFRQAVKKACVVSSDDPSDDTPAGSISPDEMLVVSYSRKVLGQTGSGHFSPIAAYDAVSDSVLILDTARFKYGAHWVPVPLLFDAMKPLDPSTNRSRGYLLLRDFDHADDRTAPSLVPSLLFRSQRKQNPVRRLYKEFLVEHNNNNKQAGVVTLDQVIAFWTLDATKPSYIWELMEPQFTPVENDEAAAQAKDMIAAVRTLIQQLIDKVPHGPWPDACCDCRVNYMRSLDLSPQEAIFVVYLASLEEGRRHEILGLVEEDAEHNDDDAKAQLCVEAELLRYAIEMSDEAD